MEVTPRIVVIRFPLHPAMVMVDIVEVGAALDPALL